MPLSNDFRDFVVDQLSAFGPVTTRRMFGGAGVYADGVMFGLLAQDALYLKVDDHSVQAYTDEGMRPFTYQPRGRPAVAIAYFEVPPRLLEDPDELAEWARQAHGIAQSAQAANVKPLRKPVKRKR